MDSLGVAGLVRVQCLAGDCADLAVERGCSNATAKRTPESSGPKAPAVVIYTTTEIEGG